MILRSRNGWEYQFIPMTLGGIKLGTINEVLKQARLMRAKGRYKPALKYVRSMLEEWPDEPDLHLLAAELHYRLHHKSSALRACKRAARLRPHWPVALVLMGDLVKREGDRKKSEWVLSALRSGVEVYPEDRRIQFSIAQLLRELGRPNEAIVALRQVIKLDADLEAHKMLAELESEVGRHDEAKKHALIVLGGDPHNLIALELLAFINLQLGDLDQALQAMTRIVHIVPTDPFSRFKLATLYHQRGAYHQAMVEYDLTVELSDQTHLAQEAQEAIEGLDRLQLQQVLTISADDPLFRAKLSHDPAKAVVQRGFHLTEASLEILRGTDFSAIPFSPRRGGTSVS